MVGRTVQTKTTYSNAPFNHSITDVQYTDGTTEQFGPSSAYIPDIGDIEDLDLTNNRQGWNTPNGYRYDFQIGNLGSPAWPAHTVQIPHSPLFPLKSSQWQMLGAPEIKQPCDKCKEEVYYSSLKRYNWSDSLEHQSLERKICPKCHTKAMDKFYDLDRSVETEEVLYGSKNGKRNDP